MPLEIADPPTQAREVVRARLSQLAHSNAFRTPGLRRASPDTLAMSTPHRVALLPLERIRRGLSLRAAVQKKGWRFLIHGDDRIVAAVETTVRRGHRFSHLNEGPFVAGTERAIRLAEASAPIKRGRFVPALLAVPALHLTALWLQDLEDTADRLIAMAPTPPEFRAFRVVSDAQFVAALLKAAARTARAPGRRGADTVG